MLEGKLILQELVLMEKASDNKHLGWDDPPTENTNRHWWCWKETLPQPGNVSIPRCYHPEGFGLIARREIHAFSDASEEAIGTATYLQEINAHVAMSLPFARSKVAPTRSTSRSRLEQCSAILTTQAVRMIRRELDAEVDEDVYYSNSKVLLGYIHNESRRFNVYAANRVQAILKKINGEHSRKRNHILSPPLAVELEHASQAFNKQFNKCSLLS